jgi:hypothetical protein
MNKSLLEKEWDILGYAVLRLVDEKGKIRYGRYTLPLYEGPPFVEDLREGDKNGG